MRKLELRRRTGQRAGNEGIRAKGLNTETLFDQGSYEVRSPVACVLVTQRYAGNSSVAAVSATLETGLEIRVPLFIKEGEKVKVSTENRGFAGRA